MILVNGQARVSDARMKGSDGHDRHGDAAIAGLLMWAASHSDLQPAAGAYVKPEAGVSPYASQRPGRGGGESVFGGRAAFQQRAVEASEGAERGHRPSGAPGSFREVS